MREDPAQIRLLASAVRLQADRLRLLALRVRAVGAVRWRAPAADLYRAQVEERARLLQARSEAAHHLARCLDDLAEALDRSVPP